MTRNDALQQQQRKIMVVPRRYRAHYANVRSLVCISPAARYEAVGIEEKCCIPIEPCMLLTSNSLSTTKLEL